MIRWLSNSRVSLQRLGFCKVAVAVCDGPRSREALSEAARRVTQMPVIVNADSDIGRWVQSRPKTPVKKQSDGRIQIAVQDQWVFQHPSQSGWLLELAHEEYFEKIGLPMMLGFVDDECQRTDWGHLLLTLNPFDSVEGSLRAANPLCLTRGDIVLFSYMLVRHDGDFLIPYLHDLTRFADKPFSYLEAGETVPAVIDEVLRRFRSAVYTGEDRDRYEDLRSAQAKIQDNIDRRVETMGSGSRREQTVLPRLEWLVDIGVLCKDATGTRNYFMPQRGRLFCERIYSEYVRLAEEGFPEEAAARLLDRRFFQLVHQLVYEERADLKVPADIISFIAPAYARLKSPTGYCVGKALLLLSHILVWESGHPWAIEYDVVRRSLEDAYQADPSRFYYTTARFGEDFQIRLEK